ncbi:MAG: hypothetical protein HY670_02680 [Chloroflexi bacterium]|nr:hypothetical protein [Chloroflexota bacterium]
MATTVPGINHEVNLTHFNDDEKAIIRRFSNQWYVTNGGGLVKLGPTSTYRYFLMKPIDIYQEMFNIEREIVVVFSPYAEFQPRTLDAIDDVVRRYQQLRIEKICSVIVSQDNLIEQKLTELLQRDPESPIVIPFSYAELLRPLDAYFLRNRFKKHFYTRDLFAFEAPLKKDLYFFGRSDLVHKIVNRHRSNENSGLFGLRKTGKTSVVFGVERTLAQLRGNAVFIDCQNPAFHGRRWYHALHYIADEIVKQNKLGVPLEPQNSYDEQNAPINFEQDILKIHESLDNRNILIIFDEIENITFRISPSKYWAKEMDFVCFWQTLRSLFQKLDGVFSYMVVGTNPLCIEEPSIHGVDNPIFNHFPFEYIPGFDVGQTRQMVRRLGRIMGLRFSEIIYAKLTEDYGGHPFLIRHVCSVINKISPQERPTDVNKVVYEQAKLIFNREYSNFIQMILNVLKNYYPDEYQMLEHLALGDIDTFKKAVGEYPNYVNHLLGYGIIERHGEDYAFQIEAVRQYLMEKGKYKKLHLTKQEMIAEISERRNLLEPKLRLIAKTQLQAGLGRAEAKEEVLDIYGSHRKSKYAHMSYDDLFNSKVCEIYFDDLRRILVKHWNLFQNIFPADKQKFDNEMQAVNKYRADAHAKDIDVQEMQYFRVCISDIESQVEEFLGSIAVSA